MTLIPAELLQVFFVLVLTKPNEIDNNQNFKSIVYRLLYKMMGLLALFFKQFLIKNLLMKKLLSIMCLLPAFGAFAQMGMGMHSKWKKRFHSKFFGY